jgi:cell division septum initiation protein DivIVA
MTEDHMASQTPVPTSGPQPALVNSPDAPQFDAVMRGYDGQQVDAWVGHALAYIKKLEHEGLSKAEAIIKAAAASPQAQRSIADLMQLAADEISHNQAAAAQKAAQVVADAEQLAEQIKAAAESEAAQLVAGAQDQANTIVQGAHAQGRSMLDEAAQKAAAVSQGAEARLAKVSALHDATLHRIQEMNSVTGSLLNFEQQRGSLEDEVERIIHPQG